MDVFLRLSAFNHVKIGKNLFAAGKPEEYLKASSKCNMFATYVFSKNTCFLKYSTGFHRSNILNFELVFKYSSGFVHSNILNFELAFKYSSCFPAANKIFLIFTWLKAESL